MNCEFYKENRSKVYENLKNNSIMVLFSGKEKRKTNDENYPFFTNRNFLYLTGIDSKEAVLMAYKDGSGGVKECIYILPPDPMIERWNGERIKEKEAEQLSGILDIKYDNAFQHDFHRLANSGNFQAIYLDLFKVDFQEEDTEAYFFQKLLAKTYPYFNIRNINPHIREIRTIKRPCEILAMKEAEKITRDGIVAMMKASKPGMYEYQYKAEYDRALGQYGPQGSAFPPIVSAGRNNFFIHYYSYKGQAQDQDMILNDVGAWHDHLMTDVSRGWPCNGTFNEKQKLLYQCALRTSDYLFNIIKPGMKMADVDGTIRTYNGELLKDAGVLKPNQDIGTYMWHGGAHHVGFDVHDAVKTPEIISPGMVFCVDVGIYHEEWGIGFRLEDNCLVTETGCENLSSITPRTIEEIEETMKKGYF